MSYIIKKNLFKKKMSWGNNKNTIIDYELWWYERDFCSFMQFYLIKECYLNNNNNNINNNNNNNNIIIIITIIIIIITVEKHYNFVIWKCKY
jgi:hypothetical protein